MFRLKKNQERKEFMQENNFKSDLIWCVIPVYNNCRTVKTVADECSLYLNNIIVVDDGSTDADITEMFSGTTVKVIRHKKNKGKGKAIISAMKYITEHGGLFMITIDADGQHYPEDLKKFIPLLQDDETSIVVGCRNFNVKNIPGSSRFGRKFASFWLRMETGISISDCQSGFRAYPLKYISKIKLYGSHYDFEAEVLARAVWAGLKLKTVDIDVWYPKPQERVSSFKPITDNVRISLMHTRLIGRRILQLIFFKKKKAFLLKDDKQLNQKKNAKNVNPVSRKRGNRLGFRIFEIFIRIFGLQGAYGLLYFVSCYYIIFDCEAVSSARSYIEKRFPESGRFAKYFHIYRLFISQGRQLIDRFSVVCSKKDLFNVKINGYEKLENIIKEPDQGMIILTSHFGNWQIALTALNKLGKKVFLLMRKEDNQAVRDFLNVGYEKGDINIISPEQDFGGVIEIMNALGKGHVVSIMGDRRYGAKASKVKFLGDYAYFPLSAFAIAASAKCPVVILLAAKFSAYEYEVNVTNILYPRCKGRKKDTELVSWIQEYANILEEFAYMHPYQCFLFHDIWKDNK